MLDSKTILKCSDILSKYGFRFEKENKELGVKYFINTDLKIIVELNVKWDFFKIIYTNKEMFGMLDSGVIKMDYLLNEGHFEQMLIQFNESVKVLRKYYDEALDRWD